MKRLLATALITLTAVGTASADFTTDLRHDLVYGDQKIVKTDNLATLPATAAGKRDDRQMKQNFGGMQDHPRERLSGI